MHRPGRIGAPRAKQLFLHRHSQPVERLGALRIVQRFAHIGQIVQDAGNFRILAAAYPVEEMESGPIHRFGFLEASHAIQDRRVSAGIRQRLGTAWSMHLKADLPGSMSIGLALGVASSRVGQASEVAISVGGFI